MVAMCCVELTRCLFSLALNCFTVPCSSPFSFQRERCVLHSYDICAEYSYLIHLSMSNYTVQCLIPFPNSRSSRNCRKLPFFLKFKVPACSKHSLEADLIKKKNLWRQEQRTHYLQKLICSEQPQENGCSWQRLRLPYPHLPLPAHTVLPWRSLHRHKGFLDWMHFLFTQTASFAFNPNSLVKTISYYKLHLYMFSANLPCCIYPQGSYSQSCLPIARNMT
jgi:hypothetical protein